MSGACAAAEMLAGAIALNEAGDEEREGYRRHVSTCGDCLERLGGEREIERTMNVVRAARDGESWQPDVCAAGRMRSRARVPAWLAGAALAGGALALGAYALAVGLPHRAASVAAPTVATAQVRTNGPSVGADFVRRPERLVPRVHLEVTHTVVTLKRPPVAPAAPKPAPPARAIAHARPAVQPVQVADAGFSAAGPTQAQRRSIGALRTTQTAAPPAQRAESLAVMPSSITIHDVFPLGGDTAIVPQPAPIAYSERAEGTTAFEVSVDERGAPVHCTITKASGYLVLDDAVCVAAMRARYSPRTIDGRPVPSVYRDAFTFRTADEP